MLAVRYGFSMSGHLSSMTALAALAALAASACQTGPGIACGDGYCGAGYTCAAEDGVWQCVRAVDDGNVGGGADGGGGAGGGGADGRADAICGDGVVDPAAGEGCDDGNMTAGDGCDARCQVEGRAESEPNEDGSPEIGGPFRGNDFDTANAEGPYESDAIIAATLVPLGDEDVFAVTNRGADPARVRFETHDAGAGLGMLCSTIDTMLYIRDAGGRALAQNDDALGLCAGVEYVLAPGETVHAHVFAPDDHTVIALPGYWMVIDFR
jgi:cysteine-rich repeat protein